ncbi:MAG: response regulator transcription factor [Chloroflexi bacterium]|nr:response regulator transcription factor [Chloroflexota bacterium]MCI0575986.1 response regulator transcription factor [Chloroflexota bacterium]MCI0648232.1 response regulator transcription factor [Chloroflexota bacterium]MCI0725196.1 response regulator transcription factor [Chloroflexota bacterium]
MAGETILVVDDEANIRELARMYLEQEGYQVIIATNGEQALAQIRRDPPRLLVLDLMLPEVDGWEVCRRVRATSNVPIIMLTARDDDIDKIVGLELGADDYVTKPFNPRELVARVRAILRRASPAAGQPAGQARQIGNVVIDPAAYEVTVSGRRVNLRAKEFDLLLTLVDHANQVLSREQLLDLVWGYEFYGHTRTVDVHVAHLRDKLADSNLAIETVWGKGYKLSPL